MPNVNFLSTGTTSVSDQSDNGTNFILGGTSINNEPTLEFVGNTSATNTYSPASLLAAYATVDVGFLAVVDVTKGLLELGGTLDLTQGPLSGIILGGNSLIDFGGSVQDVGGGAHLNAGFELNGTLTVGTVGANKLGLSSVGTLSGSGTIQQTGQNDVTNVGNVNAGVHFDIRAGKLTIGSSFGAFNGTIGPTNGNGPSLGPTASITYYPEAFGAYQVQSATFDTSTGLLSFLNASGQTLYNPFHFSGDASGLNISSAGGYLSITDHPGAGSAIPIAFS